MKKYKILSAGLLILTFMLVCPMSVFANSSWYWISETRPHDLLPFVIIVTLIIEIAAICIINKTKEVVKVSFFVLLGNLLSFASPYLFVIIVPTIPGGYDLYKTIENTPFYIVGFWYLFNTLIIETPIVYATVKRYVKDISLKSAKLIFTILGANVVTTIFTAIVERTICYGSW